MREEIRRVLKLVQEGKLSPEDAAELIEAFESGEQADATGSSGETPPPPPKTARDPFSSFVETIERMGREAGDSVNWQDVAKQVRESAKKGVETFKTTVDQVSKGRFNFPWGLNQEYKEVTLPLSLASGKTLRVDNSCGDVKVVGGFDVGSVLARARLRGATPEDAKAKADSYTLIIEESDHMVLIRQPDVSGLQVDLEVQMPGKAGVEVRSTSGNISILDTGASARVDAVSGDIRMRGLNGPVEVSGTSGNISLEDASSPSVAIENKSGDLSLKKVKGNINARTASGGITLEHCAGKSISVESVSGDVYLDMDEPLTGTASVRTVNGNATVSLMDGDCRVSLSTLRGAVLCDLPLKDEAKGDKRITGHLGEGSGTLDVSAVTGDIVARLRSHATVG